MGEHSSRQKAHYERIHDDYEAHYYDESSIAYRREFVYDELFDGLDFNGKTVADLACGSGFNSLEVLARFPHARVVGFDISEKACATYRTLTGREAHELDLTAGRLPEERFDVAMIFGGLHHCARDLPETFKTVAGLLKPGGLFLLYEPNRRYVLEAARQLWYRFDRYFDAEAEAALDHDDIARMASADFEPVWCRHMGGPAYFLIYNSLIFRIPLVAKNAIAPPLFELERRFNRMRGRFWYPYFVARWRRISGA